MGECVSVRLRVSVSVSCGGTGACEDVEEGRGGCEHERCMDIEVCSSGIQGGKTSARGGMRIKTTTACSGHQKRKAKATDHRRATRFLSRPPSSSTSIASAAWFRSCGLSGTSRSRSLDGPDAAPRIVLVRLRVPAPTFETDIDMGDTGAGAWPIPCAGAESSTIVACRRFVPASSGCGSGARGGRASGSVGGGMMVTPGASVTTEEAERTPVVGKRNVAAGAMTLSFGFGAVSWRRRALEEAWRAGDMGEERWAAGVGDVGRGGRGAVVKLGGVRGVMGATGCVDGTYKEILVSKWSRRSTHDTYMLSRS